MENFETIGEIEDGLQENYPNLTTYERLSLAIQIQRNDILIAGLNVSENDKHPSALEAIAIQLGEQPDDGMKRNKNTIYSELINITESIKSIS